MVYSKEKSFLILDQVAPKCRAYKAYIQAQFTQMKSNDIVSFSPPLQMETVINIKKFQYLKTKTQRYENGMS